MSLVDRASQAVEAQVEALRFIESTPPLWMDRQASRTALAFGQLILKQASPFWWEAPVFDLVKTASDNLPTWTVRPELFPVSHAFCLLPQDLPWTVTGQVHVTVRAIGWAPFKDGIVTIFWGAPKGTVLQPCWGLYLNYGVDVINAKIVQVADSTALEIVDVFSPRMGDGQRLLRFLGASLLFLEQKLLTIDREPIDRLARRRLEAVDAILPELRVIRLRVPKRSGQSTDSYPVDWQYRWMVRGHWRQQWFASDQSHRPIWITPYIKGPDDKPLKTPNQSVFAVIR